MPLLTQKGLGFIVADALKRLKNQRCFGGTVTTRFKDEWHGKGDTIYVRAPGTFTTVDATQTIDTYQTPAEANVPITLNHYRAVPIQLSLLDATYSLADFNQQYAAGAIEAISDYIDVTLAKEIALNTYWHHGQVGVTPNSASAFTQAKRWLAKGQAPPYGDGGRFAVLNEDAEASLLDQALVVQAQMRGSDRPLLRGEIGEIYGFRTLMNQNVYKHTGGTLSAAAAVQTNASGAAGATTLVFKGGATLTGTMLQGDVFALDHGGAVGERHYVLTADATAASNLITVSFAPGLAADIAANAAVTIPFGTDGTADTGVCNLYYHKDHTILASTKIAQPKTPNVIWAQATDSVSGLSIMALAGFAMSGLTDQLVYVTLFGVAHPRKGFACRVFG